MNIRLKKLFIVILAIAIFIINYSIPVFATDVNVSALEISSPSAILVDNYTGTVLYGKNIDAKMYPASTTKILTAILAIENCDLSEKATASYDAIMSIPSGYSIGDIKVGEELSVQDLLQVLLVHSANDAANVLGEHVGGSIESFATMMNTKAEEIGCKNSHFVNPSGKHDDNHYTTAKDLALIMQYCMKNQTFRSIASMLTCTLPATSKAEKRYFATTVELLIPSTASNKNIYYYPYAIAGKTGFTTEAQNCLVSVAKKDDLELTSVILGAGKTANGQSARFLETHDIYNYGFDNYEIKNICNKNDVINTISVNYATSETKNLDLLALEDVPVLAKKGQDINITFPKIELQDKIEAPITEGAKLGTVTYTVNDVSYKTDLIASHNVEKSPFFQYAFQAGAIALVFIIIFVIFIMLKKKNKKPNKKRK